MKDLSFGLNFVSGKYKSVKRVFLKSGLRILQTKTSKNKVVSYNPTMENNLVCRVCGSKLHSLHHPSCPIGQAQETPEMEMDNLDNDELFVIDNQILNFITNAVAIAGQEYARYKEEQVDIKVGTERWEQYRKDYFEMSDFAQAMVNVAEFKTADDVVHFLRNPNDYQQFYMLWLELSRPMDVTHETFGLFAKAVAEREKKDTSGEQTENTGD